MILEFQVLKNLQAFSRPYSYEVVAGEGPYTIQLPTGWAAGDNGTIPYIVVQLGDIQPVHADWYTAQLWLYVDQMPMGTVRPITFYGLPSDGPSGVCQFGEVADPANVTLGGWHTVTVRTVAI